MAASRKIEVQLVGDAGDLERSLAGALASLKAFGDGAQKSGKDTDFMKKSAKDAERGLYDFDKAASKVNKTMSGGPLGLFDAIGNVGYGLLKLGGFAQKGEEALGGLFTTTVDGEKTMSTLGSTLTSLAPLAGVAATGFAALGVALLVLPALAAAATFAFVALLDTLSIFAAIIAASLGPLAVFTGLLGGLGAAFAYVATQSFKNQATQKQVHDNLLKLHVAQQTYNQDLAKYGKNATQTENALIALHKAQDAYNTSTQGTALNISDIKDKFGKLVDTLSKDFRPELIKLANAARTALTFLNEMAHLPLEVAFRNLATRGVALMSKFVYGVANVLKKPFKLAVELAFGSGGGGDNAQQVFAKWWDSLTKYLFGYTATHKIMLSGHLISIDTKQVQGALDPVIAWFHRQHFVHTGLRWAHEIIDGLVRAWNHDKELRDNVRTVLQDAGHMAARAFKAAFFAEVHAIPWRSLAIYIAKQFDMSAQIIAQWHRIWSVVRSLGIAAFNAIRGAAGSVIGSIAGMISSKLSQAWGAVRTAASRAWSYITGLFSRAISVHINWPSPPGFLSHIPGFAAGVTNFRGGLAVVGERGPELVNLPRGSNVTPMNTASAGGGGDIYITLDLGEGITKRLKIDAARTARAVQAGSVWS